MRLFETRTLVASTSISLPAEAGTPEYDEDGRLYVWRFPRTAPERRAIDRDRIFEFVKKRRRTIEEFPRWQPLLPTEDTRRYLRDLRNSAHFYEDVRDLQTHTEIRVVRGSIESATPRLRAG